MASEKTCAHGGRWGREERLSQDKRREKERNYGGGKGGQSARAREEIRRGECACECDVKRFLLVAGKPGWIPRFCYLRITELIRRRRDQV